MSADPARRAHLRALLAANMACLPLHVERRSFPDEDDCLDIIEIRLIERCGGFMGEVISQDRAEYIVAAANSLPALLDAHDADTALLRELEWIDLTYFEGADVWCCRMCGCRQTQGHAADCALGARLAGAG